MAAPGPLPPTKAVSRVFILLAAIGAFVTLRVDRFMATAIETDWLPEGIRKMRTDAGLQADWCDTNACQRLPELWIWVAVIVGLLVTAFAFVALHRARAPFLKDPKVTKSTIVLLRVLRLTMLGLGLVVAAVRILVAHAYDHLLVLLTVVGVVQFAAVLLSLFVLARLVASRGEADVTWTALKATLRRQRATVAIVVFFAAFVLVLPITADQTADALRALSFTEVSGYVNALFLVASASLLSATVLEVWRANNRAQTGDENPDTITRTIVRWWAWMIIAAVLIGVGVLTGLTGWTGGGLVVLGVIALFFGILELGTREKKRGKVVADASAESVTAKPVPAAEKPTEQTPSVSAAARYVAAIPLASLSIALVSAVVVMAIAEDPPLGQWIGLLVIAGFLGVLAVLVTRTLDTQLRQPGERLMSYIDKATVVLNLTTVVLLFVPNPGPFMLIAGVAAFLTVVLHLFLISRREIDPREILNPVKGVPRAKNWLATGGWTVFFAIGTSALVFVAMHANPLPVSRALGTMGLFGVFVAGLIGIGYYLSRLSDHFAAPRSLEWFGFRQLPVFSTFLVWWIVAGLFVPGNLHDARLIDRAEGTHPPAPSLKVAFERWVLAQPEFDSDAEPNSDNYPIPLVLVASHGGGIRAAYWTGVVLDCIVGADSNKDPNVQDAEAARAGACRDRRREDPAAMDSARRIFLASSVSGGAVGMAAYSQEVLTGRLGEDWVDDRLSDDLLAPVVGWALFHDLPNHLIGLNPAVDGGCRLPFFGGCWTQDRAGVLEQAFDSGFDDPDGIGLRSTWDDRRSPDAERAARAEAVPLLVFNSSTTTEPRRAVTSAADLSDWPAAPSAVVDEDAPAPRPVSDAAETSDLLCANQDLRIATAAALAARFPFVSPSGWLHGNCDPRTGAAVTTGADRCESTSTCELQLADGGYYDNSGLMTLAEILPTLQRLVADQNEQTPEHPIGIVIVDIDNDYRDELEEPSTPERAGESLLPVTIILAGPGAIEGAAYGIIQKTVPSTCFLTIAPAKQPGIQAPLGWALSDSTRNNLTASVVLPSAQAAKDTENRQLSRIQQLQDWFKPGPPASPNGLAACVPD